MGLLTRLASFLHRPEAATRHRPVINASRRQKILAKYRQPQRDHRRQQAFERRLARYRDQGIPLRLQERARYDIRCLRVGKRELTA